MDKVRQFEIYFLEKTIPTSKTCISPFNDIHFIQPSLCIKLLSMTLWAHHQEAQLDAKSKPPAAIQQIVLTLLSTDMKDMQIDAKHVLLLRIFPKISLTHG